MTDDDDAGGREGTISFGFHRQFYEGGLLTSEFSFQTPITGGSGAEIRGMFSMQLPNSSVILQ